MASSAAFVSIPDIPESHFLNCVHLAVSKNAEYPSALAAILPAALMGVGAARAGGNYAPVMRWSEKAKTEGFGLTLHLDSNTRSEIEEFSAGGFLSLKYNKEEGQVVPSITVVVPDSQNVINSITGDSCVEIARSLGWNVEILRIPYSELSTFKEVVAVGSAVSVLSIGSITCYSTGDKFTYDIGTYSQKLGTMLRDIQQSKVDDTFGWLQEVKEMKDASEV